MRNKVSSLFILALGISAFGPAFGKEEPKLAAVQIMPPEFVLDGR